MGGKGSSNDYQNAGNSLVCTFVRLKSLSEDCLQLETENMKRISSMVYSVVVRAILLQQDSALVISAGFDMAADVDLPWFRFHWTFGDVSTVSM